MRYGRKKDIQRVEWLVKFLTTWYSKDELEDKSKRFMVLLKTTDMQDSYVYNMGEALRYSVKDLAMESLLQRYMQDYLNNRKSNLANDISPSCLETLKKTVKLREAGKTDEAIALLERSNKGFPDEVAILGMLYHDQNSYNKAEEYYLKAIDSGDNGALLGLVSIYFELAKNAKQALKYALKLFENEKSYRNTYVLATSLLWSENFSSSYERFTEWLEFEEAPESKSFLAFYLNLLISKGQHYKAKEFFEMEQYRLKDRLKPIWYALMTLMQKEFPHEIKKMGSELQESVNSVLEEIENLKTKYQI